MTIALPPRDDHIGLETRVLLSECRTPSHRSYTAADAQTCMQLMDRVIWNRVGNPRRFGAPSGASLRDIITQRGQFAGFESYPNYNVAIIHRIQDMVNIANNSRDARHAAFASHVQLAINVATDPSIADPSPGLLAF